MTGGPGARGRRLRAAGIGLIAGVWIAALIGQAGALAAHDWTIAPVWLILAGAGAAGFWLAIGLGWWQALGAVGRTISVGAALRVWSASLFWRYLPGNVWHVVGRVYLGNRAGVDRSAILAASAIEQVATVAGACLVVLMSLYAWPDGRWLGLPAALGLAAAGIALHPRTGRIAIAGLGRLTGRSIDLGAPPIGRTARVIGLTALGHFAAGCSLWAIARAIDSPADLGPAIGAAAAAWLAGYLSLLTPSGLGVREGALALLLAPDLGAPAAVSIGLLARLTLMIAEGAIGLAGGAYPRAFLTSKKSSRRTSQTK